MKFNDAGKIANQCWLEIPNHFPNANLYEHIVMPNHIHGILELVGDDNAGAQNVRVQNFEPLQNNMEQTMGAGAENFPPLQRQNEFRKTIPRSIGSIVRGVKIGVTKWFRQNTDIENVWQRNYYEHIIRNEKSHLTISEYIINNPAKWIDDKFYIK